MGGCSFVYSGIPATCKDNAGGIKSVWIGAHDSVTITPDNTTGVATVALVGEATPLKKYNTRKQTSSMTSTVTIDEAAGTVFYNTELALQFNKMSEASWVEMNAIAKGDMVAIVEDNNGKYYVLGSDFPVTCSAATGVTGMAMGELNGYTATLNDMSRDMPYYVTDITDVVEQ